MRNICELLELQSGGCGWASGSAIDGNKTSWPLAGGMNGTGKKLLARAAVTANGHRGIRGRHFWGKCNGCLDNGSVADDIAEIDLGRFGKGSCHAFDLLHVPGDLHSPCDITRGVL